MSKVALYRSPSFIRIRRAASLLASLICSVACTVHAAPQPRSDVDFEQGFQRRIAPFLNTYCLNCHDHEKPKGDFDLSPYRHADDVAKDAARWELVIDRLQSGEMPPRKAKQHPEPQQTQTVLAWVQALRRHEAAKNAGDPGPVLARRLSHAEYNYTIRELTGVDLRPTREFPVDPANVDGFDNSGESLTLSPALLKKYLRAAREVAEHLVFKPDSLAFAEHPMLVDTDRDKYCVLRIVDFYKRQPTDLADYFEAAWRYQHRRALGQSRATLAEMANHSKVSPRYLELVWQALNDPKETVGPIARLQSLWRQFPVPARDQSDLARSASVALRDRVIALRRKLVPEVRNLTVRGMHDGSQCFVLWKNRQLAANRRRYDTNALHVAAAPLPPDARNSQASQDPDLVIPQGPGERADYEAAFGRFCSLYPDAFYISERARVYMDAASAKGHEGRLLSAGFHSMTGYFRDDAPLYDLILNEAQRAELDRLWTEFDLISSVPERMHTSFLWFERAEYDFMLDAEFDFVRPEDKDSTSEANLRRLDERYCAKAKRRGAGETALAAMHEHFERVSANLRRVDQVRAEAEPKHLDSLLHFAERAYRRALIATEREDLLAFYRSLRARDGMNHEDAIRDCVVSVLMSPHFLFRIDPSDLAASTRHSDSRARSPLAGASSEAGYRAVPLSDHALASRLSYFLWSGPPDQGLLAKARAGELHRPKVIAAEAQRMLHDQRIRNLAVEFGGHWLDFRRFEEHNAVDRERFPAFNEALRQAMFEEPIQLFLHILREKRPTLDFLNADYTFVNAALAQHYGFPTTTAGSNSWVRIDGVNQFGRGGLLPMAVFQTANSPGLRTSPVKRGYWVARRVLGERIPPPPASVPELPADESKLGELTLPETLARHRADASCSGCHQRFDSLGLVFEGFGPVGERRTLDLGGRPVDTHALFPDGSEGSGLEGLKTYIRMRRQDDFLDTLCRKLLAYALGRSLILSDEITVRSMRSRMNARGGRFDSLVESIVTSPQFLNRRASDPVANR